MLRASQKRIKQFMVVERLARLLPETIAVFITSAESARALFSSASALCPVMSVCALTACVCDNTFVCTELNIIKRSVCVCVCVAHPGVGVDDLVC